MTVLTAVLSAPPLDAEADILLDWLEMAAFFNAKAVARLDAIDNVMSIQSEETAQDNGTADAARDERRGKIEAEFDIRSKALGDAYPFELSDDGEELIFKSRGQRTGACFYLNCLLISHFTRSPILIGPPANDEIDEVRRRQFQILSTLAVAGHIQGPSLSFGWPRASGESISDAITRCCEMSGTGAARIPPGPEASEFAKDGGMDVIAWRVAIDGNPPPAMMYFGQAASGHGWQKKSALHEVDTFYESYYLNRPACSVASITVVPFRLSKQDHDTYARRHGHILDRLRTPRAALLGLRLAREDGVAVDEVNAVNRLNRWLIKFRRLVRAS